MTLSRLLVKLQIPIINTPLMFHRWLPIGQENGIHYDRANYHLVLCGVSANRLHGFGRFMGSSSFLVRAIKQSWIALNSSFALCALNSPSEDVFVKTGQSLPSYWYLWPCAGIFPAAVL